MNIIKIENIQSVIIELRGENVILDSDIANIYGVETKRINEAVKNNPDKFPIGYILELSKEEWNILKSKFSTSKRGGKVKLPNAFTEKGLYMLATILNSNRATQTTLAIIETFSKLREISRNVTALTIIDDKKIQKNLMQKNSSLFTEIFDDEMQISDTETSIEFNFACSPR